MKKIDWNLKFIRDIFGVECLHFGYWEENQKVDIENLKIAQQRYIDILISKIPQGVKEILDVGCGTGEVAINLINKNFKVECVSPDEYQYEIFKQKSPNTKFYLTKFEDLVTDKKYDLVLMAESCQYLNLEKAFLKSKEILVKEGYLLISDYFRKYNTSYYKTTHTKEEFYFFVKKYDFEVLFEEDITANILPTLILAKKIYEKYALPIVEILSGYISEKFSLLTKIFNFLLSPVLKKCRYYIFEHTRDKLDEKKFNEFMEYKIILLRNS
ncbi:MAG: methyltransferase domain-containing protein [Elusimicrobiota bacterium]|nr:class I SAM-dependent methyltransferase [Endomicrobiia bacterium]MCX7910542.1 class I SAM-dependent methyltransferase [Endomicrobiia bacterium]MDW8165613.1 methyltransferase domain-containing protein [Elusimicrobiota bacterium]